MTPHPRSARSFRSLLLALLSLLTLSGSGCATMVAGYELHGDPPRPRRLSPLTPVQSVIVRGRGRDTTLRLRVCCDDGDELEHVTRLPDATAPRVVVQVEGLRPEVGKPVQRIAATGRAGPPAPLEAHEAARDVVVVAPRWGDRISIFAPGVEAPVDTFRVPPRSSGLYALRVGLRIALTPALLAIDAVTLPVQLVVLGSMDLGALAGAH